MLNKLEIRNETIKLKLSKYHRIFTALLQFVQPIWDDTFPSAGVYFEAKEFKPIKFVFNTELYNALSDEQLMFVYAHEMLHILFNHGMRQQNMNIHKIRIATDIVINEYAIRNLGFNRDEVLKITGIKSVIIHTYELHFDLSTIKLGQNFEYYYDLLPDYEESGGLDEHENNLTEHSESINKLLREAIEPFNPKDLETLELILEQGADKDSDIFRIIEEFSNVPETKLEDLFKKVTKSINTKYEYDWKVKSSKYQLLYQGNNIRIPYLKRRQLQQKEKCKLFIYLDTSTSCSNLANRFFKLVDGISKDSYEIHLFGFTTTVYGIINRKIYSGGTFFDIIEEHLQAQKKYPDNVLILTDGEGNVVSPQYPERWVVFLTQDYRQCFANADKITFKLI